MTTLNIYQRINEVQKEVEYVQKDATVSGAGSYKAVSHDMVVAVLRPHMVAQGIVVRTEMVRDEMLQMRDLEKSIKMHLYSAVYAVDFVNMDDPQDYCRVIVPAHANDTGDKAPGKATSYAVKYAMLKTFSLETGESDEARLTDAPLYTEIQKAQFDDFIANNDDPLGYICFSATTGEEVMNGLNSSFVDGKKSQGKKTMKELESKGWAILKEAAVQIEDAIRGGDSPGLLEVVSEFDGIERKLLGGLLDASQIKVIKDVQDLAK